MEDVGKAIGDFITALMWIIGILVVALIALVALLLLGVL